MHRKPLSLSRVAAPGELVALWIAAAGALALIASDQAAIARLLVLSPVAEETIFRAGLQESLHRSALAPTLANAAAALAFAAAHVALRPGLAAALTLLPALACGALYARCRRVAPCIALHSLFNAIWLLGAARIA
jgi:membrane protease YdiL (CAAX protease family)